MPHISVCCHGYVFIRSAIRNWGRYLGVPTLNLYFFSLSFSAAAEERAYPKTQPWCSSNPQSRGAYFKALSTQVRKKRVWKRLITGLSIRLINQDKNKYGTPKYRFVVWFTNKDIITQIVSTSIAGDMILTSAYAHELPRYGLDVGLTNYSAAYYTGLFLARLVLKTLEMDEKRPFRALLDVGLIRITTGALKGALDGGLDIPHSDKRFAGFKNENKQLDRKSMSMVGSLIEESMSMVAMGLSERYMLVFAYMMKEAQGTQEVQLKRMSSGEKYGPISGRGNRHDQMVANIEIERKRLEEGTQEVQLEEGADDDENDD
ncbi:hypothetical protein IFM89_016017 [Coptis chinensis]|uniref:Uncharacterized protein n=1 Tax=Coptis chinensis TaxID=261450 RepID=A0A835H4L8_9MAGN|nr:hypothetical protein IFM89_016017 [Coptis chinensis]